MCLALPCLPLKRFKSRRITVTAEPDCIRGISVDPAVANHHRARYIRPMLDFWQSLLAALERIAMLPSLIHSVLPTLLSRKRMRDAVRTYDRTMDDFLHEIQTQLEDPLEPAKLLHMSGKLQEQFAPKLQASDICFAPSYNCKLPTGLEQGTYLTMDVGGSTFRVALVELTGKLPGAKGMRIVTMKSYKIDNTVRSLQGNAFFDWMAERVEAAIADPEVEKSSVNKTIRMGLSWSFPLEYVIQPSIRRVN
jgi:hexokinase